jgi:hypothetical protein
LACGQLISPDADSYVAAWQGPRDRPEVLAVAHAARWVGPSDDDYDEACENLLLARWSDSVTAGGAGLLCLRLDSSGHRFFVGDVGLHAGAPIEVLDADGRWLSGRFEYLTLADGGWRPRFHLLLGGREFPQAAMDIPIGTVVRVPDGS